MITVLPIPCFHDNYAYLLTVAGHAESAIVDASEAAPIEAALRDPAAPPLTAILATHHHPDHVGGNVELCARFAKTQVYAHSQELVDGRVPAQTVGLADGEEFQVLGQRVQALHIPGHTLTAIAFYFPDDGLLFTGDTLFGAGCGRLFEGTPTQMHASLQRLAALPGDVRVYCGHEYTQKNLSFAAAIEPGNAAIAERRTGVDKQRAAASPSVPSTLKDELATNPFLRVHTPAVHAAAARRPPVASAKVDGNDIEVFARIRAWRNEF